MTFSWIAKNQLNYQNACMSKWGNHEGRLESSVILPSLKLTFSQLKIDGWKLEDKPFLLGSPIFRGELLVFGGNLLCFHCTLCTNRTSRGMDLNLDLKETSLRLMPQKRMAWNKFLGWNCNLYIFGEDDECDAIYDFTLMTSDDRRSISISPKTALPTKFQRCLFRPEIRSMHLAHVEKSMGSKRINQTSSNPAFSRYFVYEKMKCLV